MADRFPMYHPDVAVPGETTQDAFDAVWEPNGWRKTKSAAKPKRVRKATKKAKAAPPDGSDTTS